MSLLAKRLLAIHSALGDIPHAFGGAIALAYCTEEPRATIDLDLNVFVDADRWQRATASLPTQITITESNQQDLVQTGQTRCWWQDTPVDLFLNTHPFHTVAASRVREVPFSGQVIPVLDCTTLGVFKAFFNRTRDWAGSHEGSRTA